MEEKKTAKHWSHDERSMLRYWTSCDMPLQEIAKRLGRSERAVLRFCERNGYDAPGNTYHTWTDDEVLRMQDLLCEGKPLSELGLPYTTVKNKIYRMYGTTSEKKAAELELDQRKRRKFWEDHEHISVYEWPGDD